MEGLDPAGAARSVWCCAGLPDYVSTSAARFSPLDDYLPLVRRKQRLQCGQAGGAAKSDELVRAGPTDPA